MMRRLLPCTGGYPTEAKIRFHPSLAMCPPQNKNGSARTVSPHYYARGSTRGWGHLTLIATAIFPIFETHTDLIKRG